MSTRHAAVRRKTKNGVKLRSNQAIYIILELRRQIPMIHPFVTFIFLEVQRISSYQLAKVAGPGYGYENFSGAVAFDDMDQFSEKSLLASKFHTESPIEKGKAACLSLLNDIPPGIMTSDLKDTIRWFLGEHTVILRLHLQPPVVLVAAISIYLLLPSQSTHTSFWKIIIRSPHFKKQPRVSVFFFSAGCVAFAFVVLRLLIY